MPLRAALLGAGAAPADHPRPAASRVGTAAPRAHARNRARNRLLHTRRRGLDLPRGRLDILDLQQEMLDHTMRRTGERGLTNVTPTQADARQLPYHDAT